MAAPLALLAGGGDFPATVLSALKGRGLEVVIVGFPETDEALLRSVPRSLRAQVTEIERIAAFLAESGVKEAMMAGYVSHVEAIRRAEAPGLFGRLLGRLKDKRADSLLRAAAQQLKAAGVTLVSAMPYLAHLLPARGLLTRRAPTDEERRSIDFGLAMARGIAALDIGQTVVVKQQAVVAVESLEGTDACIRRGGEIGHGGTVVVKVAKPRQDLRFDVPVMGMGTIGSLKASGATAMAFEAGKTILLDRDTVVAAADEAGLAIVAV